MKSTPRNIMGDLIRARFRRTGMSVNELSRRSGVPYATVHAVMAGTRDPALSSVVRLCEVLGLELSPVRKPNRKGR